MTIVALDNTFLTLILNKNAKPRPDPSTGNPVSYWKDRIDAMIDAHSGNNDRILIPAPCLAETLTIVPNVMKAIDVINASSAMEIAAFDAKCAIELGLESHAAKKSGDKKSGSTDTWQKVKFDRQIAIIAKTAGASIFYTDDNGQTNFAKSVGLTVKHSWELLLPPKYAQQTLFDPNNPKP